MPFSSPPSIAVSRSKRRDVAPARPMKVPEGRCSCTSPEKAVRLSCTNSATKPLRHPPPLGNLNKRELCPFGCLRYLCATFALPFRYLCATFALPFRYPCATFALPLENPPECKNRNKRTFCPPHVLTLYVIAFLVVYIVSVCALCVWYYCLVFLLVFVGFCLIVRHHSLPCAEQPKE